PRYLSCAPYEISAAWGARIGREIRLLRSEPFGTPGGWYPTPRATELSQAKAGGPGEGRGQRALRISAASISAPPASAEGRRRPPGTRLGGPDAAGASVERLRAGWGGAGWAGGSGPGFGSWLGARVYPLLGASGRSFPPDYPITPAFFLPAAARPGIMAGRCPPPQTRSLPMMTFLALGLVLPVFGPPSGTPPGTVYAVVVLLPENG